MERKNMTGKDKELKDKKETTTPKRRIVSTPKLYKAVKREVKSLVAANKLADGDQVSLKAFLEALRDRIVDELTDEDEVV